MFIQFSSTSSNSSPPNDCRKADKQSGSAHYSFGLFVYSYSPVLGCRIFYRLVEESIQFCVQFVDDVSLYAEQSSFQTAGWWTLSLSLFNLFKIGFCILISFCFFSFPIFFSSQFLLMEELKLAALIAETGHYRFEFLYFFPPPFPSHFPVSRIVFHLGISPNGNRCCSGCVCVMHNSRPRSPLYFEERLAGWVSISTTSTLIPGHIYSSSSSFCFPVFSNLCVCRREKARGEMAI